HITGAEGMESRVKKKEIHIPGRPRYVLKQPAITSWFEGAEGSIPGRGLSRGDSRQRADRLSVLREFYVEQKTATGRDRGIGICAAYRPFHSEYIHDYQRGKFRLKSVVLDR